MAGITHLKDLFSSKGMEFIKNLFTKDVYATEKIDGSRFAFKNESGTLIFYKRDGKTPINMVDRTVMSYYESAITHIESLNISSIPQDVLFGFEYFANNNPGSIVYDKIPKNGLILTDISKGGIMITNIDELTKYAKQLKTSPPPVLHVGKLSSTQIEQIEEFLLADWEELITKFKTQSFTTYIISILNPSLKNTTLNMGITKPIEGIVFSFDDGGTFINTKVVDPLYTQKAREGAKSRQQNLKGEGQTKLKEVIKDVIKFVNTEGNPNIKYTSKTKELRYVELVSDLFYQYYEKNKSKFKSISARSIEFKELDVNYNNIPHSKLKAILKSNDKVKTVFKTYLAAFGKIRKRGTNAMDKTTISDVNSMIPKFKKLSENTINYSKLIEDKLDRIINLFSNV